MEGSTITDSHAHSQVAPLALMVENAGGASSCDGKCVSALDIPILNYDQRTEICFGSIGEVTRFEEYLYGELRPECGSNS